MYWRGLARQSRRLRMTREFQLQVWRGKCRAAQVQTTGQLLVDKEVYNYGYQSQ